MCSHSPIWVDVLMANWWFAGFSLAVFYGERKRRPYFSVVCMLVIAVFVANVVISEWYCSNNWLSWRSPLLWALIQASLVFGAMVIWLRTFYKINYFEKA